MLFDDQMLFTLAPLQLSCSASAVGLRSQDKSLESLDELSEACYWLAAWHCQISQPRAHEVAVNFVPGRFLQQT